MKHEKELRNCIEYCILQNGMERCKNCGLDKEIISNALDEAYEQGKEDVLDELNIVMSVKN